ncbi:alcohol dehydrogenase catalytic domain-containing protein [bacterium]|nr:alcohol dehydrogenase catalytic domain-containing protein [bacterium]
MKAAIFKNHKIEITEIEKPSLDNKKGAIVKLSGCGLCGSDIVKYRENLVKDGTVLGHEIVGEIVEIDSETNFKIGDRIVSSHHIPCFECVYCQNKNYSMCKHFKETNIFPGGFAEYIYLSEEHLKNVAHLIPNNLTDMEIAFYEPLGCCVRAIKRCELKENSKVIVIGLGSIGFIMAQGLKAFGMDVYGCDLIEDRITLAKNVGIKAFSSNDTQQTVDFIKSETNDLGADAIFMTSGADATIDLALKTVRSGGKILIFASTPKNFGYANNEIYYRELTVLGSYSPSPKDLEDSYNLLKDGKVNVHGISTIFNINDTQKAFDDTISNKVYKAYIKISE